MKNPDSPAVVRHRPLVTMDEIEAFLEECRADPWFQGRPDLADRLEGLLTEFYLAGEGPEWQATRGSSSGGSRPQRYRTTTAKVMKTFEKPNHRSLTLAARNEVARCRAATVRESVPLFFNPRPTLANQRS